MASSAGLAALASNSSLVRIGFSVNMILSFSNFQQPASGGQPISD